MAARRESGIGLAPECALSCLPSFILLFPDANQTRVRHLWRDNFSARTSATNFVERISEYIVYKPAMGTEERQGIPTARKIRELEKNKGGEK